MVNKKNMKTFISALRSLNDHCNFSFEEIADCFEFTYLREGVYNGV